MKTWFVHNTSTIHDLNLAAWWNPILNSAHRIRCCRKYNSPVRTYAQVQKPKCIWVERTFFVLFYFACTSAKSNTASKKRRTYIDGLFSMEYEWRFVLPGIFYSRAELFLRYVLVRSCCCNCVLGECWKGKCNTKTEKKKKCAYLVECCICVTYLSCVGKATGTRKKKGAKAGNRTQVSNSFKTIL